MKNISNIKFLGLIIGISVVWGCGKHTIDLLNGNQDVYSSIYMPQAVAVPAVYQFNFSPNRDSIIYGANFGGPAILTNDIHVDFVADTALVATYNAANFTNYRVMPAGSYSFSQNSAVLAKDKRSTAPLKLSIYTSKLDGVGGYLLPVTIKSTDNIKVSDALKTTYFLINGSYATNPYSIFDNSNYKIASLSSEETTGEGTNNGRGIYAFDKNPDTFWSTAWKVTKPGPPHYIIIDMQAQQKLRGFVFTGRKDAATGGVKTTGNPRDIIIQTSTDGVNWNYSQAFSLANVLVNTIYLNYAQTARFFKVTVNTSQGDTYLTHIAEINAF